ncbi:hypothetical protein D3OALGA1CA_3094 [Olavius algarvensis associated proteobacterium Delta 3]|nr:hypothetical protein D3OALGA1CA_3094 [Olavius algarvensis associated proteobacterium Delta 3]CAB5158542.1 hypothetical protein D3OALGB2SA_5275 [Olavius algarvensis associated proteobacterium Delta 3]
MARVFLMGLMVLPILIAGMSKRTSGQDFGPGNLYHWAYSPAFGTGAYQIGDEETFVVTVKPRFRLRNIKKHGYAFNLRVPISIGLQTINPEEFNFQGLEETFTTISVVPGVEFFLPLTQRWMIRPFANAGWGTTVTGDESAWIYFGGVDSRYTFGWGKADLSLLNGLQWYGYTPNPGGSNAFGRFLAGLEADHPLGKATFRGQQLLIRPHILYYWYFNEIDFQVFLEQPVSINQEVEVALAIGTKDLQKFWLLWADRIGIGYRFSEDSQGIRVFLRSVFDYP